MRARPFLKRALQLAERGLRASQISRLQSLSDGGKILFALRTRERVSAGKRSDLAELNNVVISGFSAGQVA